jgi:hypothetical protein
MANNRMYITHRPTGKSVYIGKRMGCGWYGVPENLSETVQNLFEDTEETGKCGQDDFIISMEDASEAPKCTDKWTGRKGPDGRGITTLCEPDKQIDIL